MAQAIKVLVVDDHPVVREGLAAMLGRLPGIAVVGEAPDGQQALEMAGRLAPDVILMDMRMPVMDGVEATRRLAKEHPAMRVLVLTTFDQDEMILAGLRAGARGYLLKDSPREDIARAIADVAQGKVILHPLVAARVVEHATAGRPAVAPGGESAGAGGPGGGAAGGGSTGSGPAAEGAQAGAPGGGWAAPVRPRQAVGVAAPPDAILSERELDVLRCLSLGLANKEIAQRLKIAESTVKTHLANIFSKLGVSDRTEAVTAAIRRGWIQLR